MIKARFWPGFLVVVAGWCSGAWCFCCVCVVWGGAVAVAGAGGEERGMGRGLEGDDAVHKKSGLIFVRPLEFESVTFLEKLFSQ